MQSWRIFLWLIQYLSHSSLKYSHTKQINSLKCTISLLNMPFKLINEKKNQIKRISKQWFYVLQTYQKQNKLHLTSKKKLQNCLFSRNIWPFLKWATFLGWLEPKIKQLCQFRMVQIVAAWTFDYTFLKSWILQTFVMKFWLHICI